MLMPIILPAAREARAWTRNGWRLDRPAYEQRALSRLAGLTKQLATRGLYAAQASCRLHRSRSLAQLAGLPVLTRSDFQAMLPKLRAAYSDDPQVRERSTSGSVGRPVTHLYHPELELINWGMQQEMLQLVGWRPGLPRICLWGSTLQSSEAYRPGLSARLKLVQAISNYAPGPADFETLQALIMANAPCAVYGYSSLLHACAQWMLAADRRLPAGKVAAAWGGAESLLPYMRQDFSAAFGLPLRDFYGSRECAGIAAECACGRRHLNSRYILEAVAPEDFTPLPDGEVGTLLITDLFNRTTPFIRYELCDRGAVEWVKCPCGRKGFALTQLTGRVSEQISMPDGRSVSCLAFGEIIYSIRSRPIECYKCLRVAPDTFELHYVGRELSADELEQIERGFAEILGGKVQCRRVEHVEPTLNGKLIRYVDLTRPVD